MHPILKEVEKLPPQAQQQIFDLVAALLQEHQRNPDHRLKQDWAGALSAYREQYTSLSLQQETVDEWSSRVSD
jgi:mRNA-degrading endonuclease YafQ of YafQ-DinJ toxin-antitoxin module